LERQEVPKFIIIDELIDSIVYDLAEEETGFILIN
jgi:hypothetical protein